MRVVGLTTSGHVKRTEALRRAESGWAHGAIEATLWKSFGMESFHPGSDRFEDPRSQSEEILRSS